MATALFETGYIKKCSTTLIIREVQMKTIMKCQLMPVRMVIIKNTENIKCWQGFGKERIHAYC
jgi:hypothetical protein